jgi:hypothetical protein
MATATATRSSESSEKRDDRRPAERLSVRRGSPRRQVTAGSAIPADELADDHAGEDEQQDDARVAGRRERDEQEQRGEPCAREQHRSPTMPADEPLGDRLVHVPGGDGEDGDQGAGDAGAADERQRNERDPNETPASRRGTRPSRPRPCDRRATGATRAPERIWTAAGPGLLPSLILSSSFGTPDDRPRSPTAPSGITLSDP